LIVDRFAAQTHRQPIYTAAALTARIRRFSILTNKNMLLKFFFVTSLIIGMAAGFGPNTTPIKVGTRYATIFRPTSTLLGVAVDTSDIKNGMTLELDGEPYKVLSFSIMKQARGAAKTTIKMKNLIRGTTIENTYRSGEKFETALIEKSDHQFTYEEGVSLQLQHACR
jgi:hypothetical protein